MESNRVHVAEYRPRSDIADGLRRREERVGRYDHLIVGSNSRSFQGEFQGRGSRAYANRIFASNEASKFLFEPFDPFAAHELPGNKHSINSTHDVVPERFELRFQIKERNSDPIVI